MFRDLVLLGNAICLSWTAYIVNENDKSIWKYATLNSKHIEQDYQEQKLIKQNLDKVIKEMSEMTIKFDNLAKLNSDAINSPKNIEKIH